MKRLFTLLIVFTLFALTAALFASCGSEDKGSTVTNSAGPIATVTEITTSSSPDTNAADSGTSAVESDQKTPVQGTDAENTTGTQSEQGDNTPGTDGQSVTDEPDITYAIPEIPDTVDPAFAAEYSVRVDDENEAKLTLDPEGGSTISLEKDMSQQVFLIPGITDGCTMKMDMYGTWGVKDDIVYVGMTGFKLRMTFENEDDRQKVIEAISEIKDYGMEEMYDALIAMLSEEGTSDFPGLFEGTGFGQVVSFLIDKDGKKAYIYDEYASDSISSYRYDEDFDLVSATAIMYGVKYEEKFDKDQNVIYSLYEDGSDKFERYCEYENGLVIKETEYENGEITGESTYEYDEHGNETRCVMVYGGERYETSSEYIYNEDGRVVTRKDYSDGELDSTTTFDYHDNGEIKRSLSVSPEGDETETKYDPDGSETYVRNKWIDDGNVTEYEYYLDNGIPYYERKTLNGEVVYEGAPETDIPDPDTDPFDF